jgi:oligopeptide transport system permease protein
MIQRIVLKLLRVLAILLGVLVVIFILIHAIPGNPLSNFSTAQRGLTNYSIDQATMRNFNQRFGLDQPIWRQFTRYLFGDYYGNDGGFVCGVICGNLGPSVSQGGRNVENILFSPPPGKSFWFSQFGYSIRLVLLGSLIAVGLGVPLGILGAKKHATASGRMLDVILAAAVSIPNFVLGLLAMIILASWLHLIKVLPDWNDFGQWIVPAFVLSLMPMANIARMLQVAIVNIQNEDYVRTARAKGLVERRVTIDHILRNAYAPFITYLGPTLVELFAGLFIVESLYSFPGFGRQYWMAVLKLDYPLILGLTLIYTLGIALVNILVELTSEIIDPRLLIVKEQDSQ